MERGYGLHLMALAAFARRIGIRFERQNGLLTNEIVCLHRRICGRREHLLPRETTSSELANSPDLHSLLTSGRHLNRKGNAE